MSSDLSIAVVTISGAVSRWPRSEVSRSALAQLYQDLRGWYYTGGGLYMSGTARKRYGDMQAFIAALLAADAGPDDLLDEDRYTDLMKSASAMRTALTEDLDTRRRKSRLELWRRARWHAKAAAEASRRLERVTDTQQPAPIWSERCPAAASGQLSDY